MEKVGGRAALAGVAVLMTSFIGNFLNVRFQLLFKLMQIIDSKFPLLLFCVCVIVKASVQSAPTIPSKIQGHFIRF